MFERDIEVELKKWQDSPIRKVLVLRGARQVGKTSVVRKFGGDNFRQVVEVNLENKEHQQIFAGVLSVADFVQRVEVQLGKELVDGESLLFVDEIQESQEMLELLRFFVEERPKLHVVVAGSLLEAKMAGKWSVPVGRVEYMYLYPLTFFEYLRVVGQEKWREYLSKLQLGQKMTGEVAIQRLFRDYMLVGGMPEVVESYVKNKNMLLVQEIQSRLQTSYIDDIAKYASSAERKYLELVIVTAPKLAGELFKYENMGESGYRGREMREAVEILEKIMLLRQVKSVNSVELPLLPKEKRAKKMIYLDTGMVNYINKVQSELMGGKYRGKVMEQVVGQILIASSLREKRELYYWARDRDQGSAEVDFVLLQGEKVVAMEVKLGETRVMKSMFSMLESGGNKIVPVRVGWDVLKMEKYKYRKQEYEILSLPFYLLDRWEELVG